MAVNPIIEELEGKRNTTKMIIASIERHCTRNPDTDLAFFLKDKKNYLAWIDDSITILKANEDG